MGVRGSSMRKVARHTDVDSETAAPSGAVGRTTRTSRIQRRSSPGAERDPAAAVDSVAGSSGAPIPEAARGRFEQSLGVDLGGVRVHTGAASAEAARDLSAQAFATGQDIHFGAGQYRPDDPYGMHLLAHEVAHTVQQGPAHGAAQTKVEVSEAGDPLEVEADHAADAMIQGLPARVSSATAQAARRVQRSGGEGTAPFELDAAPRAEAAPADGDGTEAVDGNAGSAAAGPPPGAGATAMGGEDGGGDNEGAMAEGSAGGGGEEGDDATDAPAARGTSRDGAAKTATPAGTSTDGIGAHDPATAAAIEDLGARGQAAGGTGADAAGAGHQTTDVPAPPQHAAPARDGQGASPSAGRAIQRRALVQRQDDRPAAAALLGADWVELNEPGIVKDETGANLRSSPSSQAGFVHLPVQTKVHILSQNRKAHWYAVVTGDGQLGYIADWLLFRHVPEPGANVYLIKRGDTPIDIARTFYGRDFTRWGQDLRFVVNALVYVNSRANHNGTGDSGLAKPGSVSESWIRSQAKADVYIWLPSTDYLNSIWEEVRTKGGGTGSISYDLFAEIAPLLGELSVIPSYVGGLAHGFVSSVADTARGIFDLVHNIFTGEIIGQLKALWSALKKLTWDDIAQAFDSWVGGWKPRLFSENPFVRGHAWGYLAGYLIGEIALFAVGGEALEALKASKLATKIGQILSRVAPRLVAGINRLRALGGTAFEAASEAVSRRYGQVVKAVTALLSKLEVRRLAKILGKAELDALLPHVKVPRQLLTMADHVGDETFKKLMRQWSSSGDFAKMNRFLERMAAGAGRQLGETAAVGSKSIIIDSNTAIALMKDADPLAKMTMNAGEVARVNYIKGLPAGTELRVANVSVGEIAGGKIAVRGLPLDVVRNSAEYRTMLAKLETMNLGGATGAADRAIIADTFYAQSEAGAVPRFITGDKSIYNKLAKEAGIDPAKLGKPIAKAFPDGFEVTISGRRLKVIPVAQ